MHMLRRPPQTHAGGEDLELPLHTKSVPAVPLSERSKLVIQCCAKHNVDSSRFLYNGEATHSETRNNTHPRL